MISEMNREIKITKMSLAVAKDSGWYEVDLSLGENYYWGKDEGCDIFAKTCSHTTVSEFCSTLSELACTDNHLERTYCSSSTFNATCPIDTYGESCKVYKETTDNEYYYGKDSVCLNQDVRKYLYNNI